MKNLKLLFALILIIQLMSIQKLEGQLPFDCKNAIEVCDKEIVKVKFDSTDNSVVEDILELCTEVQGQGLIDIISNNTVWLRYEFASGGDFLFTISPETKLIDLDFVLFKSMLNTCEQLESIRCMFSGSNISSEVTICLGETGLSRGSMDLHESSGCIDDSDNFLAPVEVEEGDVLFLAITSFTGEMDYSVISGGSAMISCMSLNSEIKEGVGVEVYPNPAREVIKIEIDGLKKNRKIEVWNYKGEIVLEKRNCDKEEYMSLDNLPEGIYFFVIKEGDEVVSLKKIIKVE